MNARVPGSVLPGMGSAQSPDVEAEVSVDDEAQR